MTEPKKRRGRPPKNPSPAPVEETSTVDVASVEPLPTTPTPKTDNVVTAKVPDTFEDPIKVETNGNHQLHDPVTNATIPHDKAVIVDRKNPFVVKMLERAKRGGNGLKEVK